MPTPHNSAAKGDFARTVLMPGDPLRARYIAEKLLENPRSSSTMSAAYRATPGTGRVLASPSRPAAWASRP